VLSNKITVKPVLGQDLIGFETDIYGQVAMQVASLQDQIVRAQLIAAGWTPPVDQTHELRKRDDLIHTMLCALVQSSPYTDRTYAWKSDAWARQRAEAISAAIAWLGEVRG